MDLETRVSALNEAGWETDTFGDSGVHDVFESLVHELAHNLILGDMRPKTMGDTATLIRVQAREQADQDEILTTAVTIQVCETFYHTTKCSDTALTSVAGNLCDSALRVRSDEHVIDALNTQRVMQLSAELFSYIESLLN